MKKKSLIAFILTTCLLTASTATPVFAAGAENTTTSSAADSKTAAGKTSTGKEEVVYIMTDAAGSVQSVNVVNIFGKGEVTDYGDYSQVKMLTSTAPITLDGDKITFTTDDEKVYYQGTMDEAQIPWNIAVSYTLDGKKVTAEELAGQSGALKIQIKITENTRCHADYYNSYALQAALTLDTANCENIVVDGATMANVGSSKQISYTVLPGKGLDAEISADVTDFEMDAIAINGVKLNLDIDIDDEELMDKVTEIMDASRDINDGASSLNDGSIKLQDASDSLSEGVNSLYEAADSLDEGIASLNEGVLTLQQGLNALQAKSSSLTGGSAQMASALAALQASLKDVAVSTESLNTLLGYSSDIKNGITAIYEGACQLQQNLSYQAYKDIMAENGLDIDTLKAQNDATITALSKQVSDMQTTVAQLKSIPDYQDNEEYVKQIAQLESSISQLSGIVALLQGNNAAIGGTESYLNAMNGNVASLVQNLQDLKGNYEQFDASLAGMAETLSGLGAQMSALKSAVNELNSKYQTLHSGITEYTNGVATVVAGYNQLVEGFRALVDGSKELVEGTGTLKSGTSDLYDGIVSLTDGAGELYDGTNEFYEKTSDMDTQVEDTIDDMLSSLSGNDTETVSFASDKNKEVSSVQFVIKTAAIEKEEDTSVVEEASAEKTTFWQKFLHLFVF